MPEANQLFTPDFLRRLEQLRLVTLRASGGRLEGARLGRSDGGLSELRGHRQYSPGDDLRFVDWQAFARLERLFIKQFVREEASSVTVLVDASGSMAAGSPPKYAFAARLAAALAYVALVSLDSVRVGTFAGGDVSALPPRTGAGAIREFMDLLQRTSPHGPTRLAESLRQAATALRRPGTLIVVSDLWEDLAPHQGPLHDESDPPVAAGLLGVLRALAQRGFDVVLVQVLSRDEVEPPPAGRYELIDSETGVPLALTLTEESRSRYIQLLSDATAQLDRHAAHYGLRTLHLVSDEPFEEALVAYLRSSRLVR